MPGTSETRSFKEENRLSYLVHTITNEASLFPQGAIIKASNDQIIQNPSFNGLTQKMASMIENYKLLKVPEFLLANDIENTLHAPEDRFFSLTFEIEPGVVCIKSIYWPGMVLFHKCNTKLYGFCYIGNGFKNLDLLFM